MKILERAIICLILLLISYAVCGCDEEPVEGNVRWNDWKSTEPTEPNESIILELDCDYEIIIQEPNRLVVELWDTTGWYANNNEDIIITTLRRVEVKRPYIITKQEQGYLQVEPPEPNEPEWIFKRFKKINEQNKWIRLIID